MRYDRQAMDELRRNYDKDSVLTCIRAAERDLADIRRYLDAAHQQLRLIEDTKFRKVVYLERHKHDRVWWYVGLRLIPEIPEAGKVYYPVVGVERFPGNEKKAAREYAERLAKEYGAEIEVKA